jgi:Ion channel
MKGIAPIGPFIVLLAACGAAGAGTATPTPIAATQAQPHGTLRVLCLSAPNALEVPDAGGAGQAEILQRAARLISCSGGRQRGLVGPSSCGDEKQATRMFAPGQPWPKQGLDDRPGPQARLLGASTGRRPGPQIIAEHSDGRQRKNDPLVRCRVTGGKAWDMRLQKLPNLIVNFAAIFGNLLPVGAWIAVGVGWIPPFAWLGAAGAVLWAVIMAGFWSAAAVYWSLEPSGRDLRAHIFDSLGFGYIVVSMIGFFAWAYLILHAADSGSFHEMSRIDAIYLAVTTLTTVGSGTLSPNDDAARALVAVNSLSSLFVIAVGVALLIGGLRSAASSR